MSVSLFVRPHFFVRPYSPTISHQLLLRCLPLTSSTTPFLCLYTPSSSIDIKSHQTSLCLPLVSSDLDVRPLIFSFKALCDPCHWQHNGSFNEPRCPDSLFSSLLQIYMYPRRIEDRRTNSHTHCLLHPASAVRYNLAPTHPQRTSPIK